MNGSCRLPARKKRAVEIPGVGRIVAGTACRYLNPDGSVSLRWRCNNPTGSSGTIYNIRRRLSTQADFEFVGAVGTRKYTDFAIPPGTASVQYTVTGQRGAAAGLQSSPFMILFGYGGGGLTIASQYVADGGGDGGGSKAAA